MTRRTVNGPGGGKIKIWVCREKRKGSGCGCRNVKEEELLKYQNRYVRTQAEFDSALAAWETLSLENLVHYGVYDLENDPERTEKTGIAKANALLDDAHWTLNEKGEPYQAGVDEVRCKEIDGELVPLRLKMMYPEGNRIVDSLQKNFIDNLNQVGITLELVPAPMQDLLYSYYRQTDRTSALFDLHKDGYLHFLYVNKPYRQQLHALGYSCQDVEDMFNRPTLPTRFGSSSTSHARAAGPNRSATSRTGTTSTSACASSVR